MTGSEPIMALTVTLNSPEVTLLRQIHSKTLVGGMKMTYIKCHEGLTD